MKKIVKGIFGIIKGILGNLDYVATFILGALAYKFAPEQLESIALGIQNFDYNAAIISLSDGAKYVVDGAVSLYNQAVLLFA